MGTVIVPIFCFAQKQTSMASLDANITSQIDTLYESLYFEDYTATAVALDKQIKIATENNRWHLVINALSVKAKCAYLHDVFKEILPVLLEAERVEKINQEALEILDSTHLERSEIFYVRGMYYYTLGDFGASIRSFEEIIKIDQKFSSIDPMNLQSIYLFMGYCYFEMMLYDKAYVHYEQASGLLPENNLSVDDLYQQAKTDLFMGKCKEYKARVTQDNRLVIEALHMYKRAFKTLHAIKGKVKNQNALRSAYIRLAASYRMLGKYDSALYYLQTSLAINKEHEYKTYVDLGDVYLDQKQYKKALASYADAFEVVSAVHPNKHFEKSIPLLKKAEVLMLTNQYEDALKTCQAGLTFIVKDFDGNQNIFQLPANTEESNLGQLLDGVWLKAKILFKGYEHNGSENYLEESIKTYQYALGVIDEMQNSYPESTYKQDLAAKVQSCYEDALEAVFIATEKSKNNSRDTNLFLSLLESNKNTLLRESFNNTYAKSFTNIPQPILDQETSLMGMMASLKRKIYDAPYDSALKDWKASHYTLSKQYDSLVSAIKKGYPEYYQLKHAKNQFSPDELKNTLDSKTVLIEYFWGDRNLYILAVGKNRQVLKKVSHVDSLSTVVRKLLETIHNPVTDNPSMSVAADDFVKTSYSLYHEILDPVLGDWHDETIQSLVIIPDGLLCYIPFDLLLTSLPSTTSAYNTLPFLLKDYSIRNLFSASFLTSTKNPNRFKYAYLGFAPIYKKSTASLTSAVRSGHVGEAGFLMHNVSEVKQASSFFNGKTFVNEEATEFAFRDVAGQAKILHLSMHAFTNDYDPSFSGLIFSQYDSTQSMDERDGLMHLYELYNLSLNADLAVLSACETGTGKYARGEGIISLGRAFRYAGCENIVMSLWKVNDKSTTEIMKSFFQNLDEGMDKDEALRQAKLTFLTSPENKYFSHPYYWSAFVLTGDTLPVTASALSVWVYVGVILGLLLLLLLFILRKQRAKLSAA